MFLFNIVGPIMVSHLRLAILILFVVQLAIAKRLSLLDTLRSTGKPHGNSTTWAVLVAGSYGYYNYRHQVDIYSLEFHIVFQSTHISLRFEWI